MRITYMFVCVLCGHSNDEKDVTTSETDLKENNEQTNRKKQQQQHIILHVISHHVWCLLHVCVCCAAPVAIVQHLLVGYLFCIILLIAARCFFSHSRSIVWFHIRSSSSVRCFGWTIRQKLKIEARILHLKRSDHQWKWTGIVSGALAYFMWHGMSPINWASTGMHLLSAEAFHKWFRAVWTIDSVNTHYCQYWSSAWNAIVHAHDCTTAIFI